MPPVLGGMVKRFLDVVTQPICVVFFPRIQKYYVFSSYHLKFNSDFRKWDGGRKGYKQL